MKTIDKTFVCLLFNTHRSATDLRLAIWLKCYTAGHANISITAISGVTLRIEAFLKLNMNSLLVWEEVELLHNKSESPSTVRNRLEYI